MLKKKVRLIVLVMTAAMLVAGAFAPAMAQEWKPTRPITLVVPWDPGGSTDLTARLMAGPMSEVLGVDIVVVNQPGAAGAIGTMNVLNAPRDGYTWGSNSDTSGFTYATRGFVNTTHRDWHTYFPINNVNIIVVNPNSPIQDVDDLIEAMNSRPVNVATAGFGSSGHVGAEQFKLQTGAPYVHVPYDGGGPAVNSTVSGETEVVMQLAMEVADHIKAGTLRPIAAMTDQPIVLEGYGEIPPITDWIPNFPPTGSRMGIFVPRGVPDEVIAAIDQAFLAVLESEALQRFAVQRGVAIIADYGEATEETNEQVSSLKNWLLYDAGVAEVSPAEFNIPRLGE